MKSIKKDNTEIFQISDVDLKLMADELVDVEDEINRRIQWVIEHKCEQVYKRFRQQWEGKLKSENVETIPMQKEAFVNLITVRADYKNRAQREAEEAQGE